MTRRPWLTLTAYQMQYGEYLSNKYRVPENRPTERTCMWCHGDLPTKRHKSFCSDQCSKAWYYRFVSNNRAPLPWRIMCRDKFTCQDCGWMSVFVNEHGIEHPQPNGLEVHHIQHVEHGGSDHEDNLVTLCEDCHLDRHGKKRRKKEDLRTLEHSMPTQLSLPDIF